MTVHTTSRRAMLKGAAMLTAVPVAALGGVPLFDVLAMDAPPVPAWGLSTYEGRIAAVVAWFDLEPPAFAYDLEAELPGLLFTDELAAWLQALPRPTGAWIVSGKPWGYSREQALADLAESQREQAFAEAISRLDAVELSLFLAAIERAERGEVPMETALAECKEAVEAYRAGKAA